MPSLQFSRGIRRLMDAHQRYMRAGAPVYLRLKNFPDLQNRPWSQLGFQISPSGTSDVGVSDVLVVPQPSVLHMSIHNIGMSAGKLRFGARQFFISQTFVESQMAARALSDQTLVWRGSDVVGLFNDGLLFSIEDIRHEEVAGKTVSWIIIANANEVR